MHNMSGVCDAGVVRVEELIRAQGGVAYCGTFSLGGDSPNTMRNFFRQSFWRQDPGGQGGSLVCSMLRCVQNDHGFCNAPRVTILPPNPPESRFAPCGSYEKRERHP